MLDTIYKMSLSTQVIMQLFAYAAVFGLLYLVVYFQHPSFYADILEIYLYTNQCCYYI